MNEGELQNIEYHRKVHCSIATAARSLISLGRQLGYFVSPSHQQSACLGTDNEIPKEHDNAVLDKAMHHHEHETASLVSLNGEIYILPSMSSFLNSDATKLQPVIEHVRSSRPFDLIVIDPPWYNKSAKRKRMYSFMSLWQIKALPVPELIAPGGLLAVWVTNKAKYIRFTRSELLPSWGVDVIAEWHWIKVTKTGEYVVGMESAHKKPYETLIIGRCNKQISHQARQQEGDSLHLDSTAKPIEYATRNYGESLPILPGASIDGGVKQVPEHQVICSVPCLKHSRKPPLGDVFKDFLPRHPHCLEMFARNLTPGWTSWGNQVLKFQHIGHFEQLDRETPSCSGNTTSTRPSMEKADKPEVEP
ncbi:N(6)-adenine-specific methyltransferase METTL4 [Nematostella vectensis]|uniref:N(6)-adenine-specific methyltransferase METTL4 n=1 Tax=Nematostella vectensis TaxID=45351 RepID=UPI00138FF784|nr:N(6)-adenine-specific methyltransferase METTL4 [Nematostella vectensis]